jgi:hypothetical protein
MNLYFTGFVRTAAISRLQVFRHLEDMEANTIRVDEELEYW